MSETNPDQAKLIRLEQLKAAGWIDKLRALAVSGKAELYVKRRKNEPNDPTVFVQARVEALGDDPMKVYMAWDHPDHPGDTERRQGKTVDMVDLYDWQEEAKRQK